MEAISHIDLITSTRPTKKGLLLSRHGVKWETFQDPGKPLKRARQIGQTLLCHEWLPKETVPKRMLFGFFLGSWIAAKTRNKIPGILKSLNHLGHQFFSSFDPSFRQQFYGFSFTEFHQQPGICASISSFTVVFSTSSSPKVLNHSAESAWFNSAASNLVLVANMASAPTPAKPRLPGIKWNNSSLLAKKKWKYKKTLLVITKKTTATKNSLLHFWRKTPGISVIFWLLAKHPPFRQIRGVVNLNHRNKKYLHPCKLLWPWKTNHLKMYLLIKKNNDSCHHAIFWIAKIEANPIHGSHNTFPITSVLVGEFTFTSKEGAPETPPTSSIQRKFTKGTVCLSFGS